jgi:Zn-dependent peptidase ImmA (M78 family)
MYRPKYIRLLGVSIPVIVSNSKSEDPEEEVFGVWDPNEMTITVNAECGEVQERVTVLHELVHAIDDFLDLEMSHQEVYVLSQVMYQVLIDNPKFVDYLLHFKEPEVTYSTSHASEVSSTMTDWEASKVRGKPKQPTKRCR